MLCVLQYNLLSVSLCGRHLTYYVAACNVSKVCYVCCNTICWVLTSQYDGHLTYYVAACNVSKVCYVCCNTICWVLTANVVDTWLIMLQHVMLVKCYVCCNTICWVLAIVMDSWLIMLPLVFYVCCNTICWVLDTWLIMLQLVDIHLTYYVASYNNGNVCLHCVAQQYNHWVLLLREFFILWMF